jgi:protein phosphatase
MPEPTTIAKAVPPDRWTGDPGPYDVIGDVHGCLEELRELLGCLGYEEKRGVFAHPEGRRAVFLGDLANRGPSNVGVLRAVCAMVTAGSARYAPGNHCRSLYRILTGLKQDVKGASLTTLAELDRLEQSERARAARDFIETFEGAPPYLILDRGRLVVAHAGIEEAMIGEVSDSIVSFVLKGEVTGRTPEGRPIRRDWASTYRGAPLVVYGHTPQPGPRFVNNTANVDQGCVYGGMLSALRYPEREFVSVPAREAYWPRAAPSAGS